MASTHNVLVRAIRHAEANDHVGRNVASFVKPPQGKTGRPSRAMTAAEAAALLAAAKGHPRLGAYVILSLTTGIRTEEARALGWDHVDLDGDPDARTPMPPSIAVWRSVRLHGDTKTEKSRRTLALPQYVVTALREHRKWQAEVRLAAGPLWQDTGLVFTTSVGTPWMPRMSGATSGPSARTRASRASGRRESSGTRSSRSCRCRASPSRNRPPGRARQLPDDRDHLPAREQLHPATDGKLAETPPGIRDPAIQRQVSRAEIDERPLLLAPGEDPVWGDLGKAFPAWQAHGRDAILQPPKPEIIPSARILQLPAERETERDHEAAD